MSAPHDLDLMQRADGELAEHPAAGLDAELARDPIAAAKLAALGETAELVRGHLELAADEVPDARFDAVWREVDKAIELAADHSGAIAVAPPSPGGGAWHRLGRWLERFRGYVITGAISAGVVAAFAIVLRPATPTDDDRPSGPIQVRPVAQRAPAVIEALDVPNGTGNVINVHDEDGNTTVIWVTPADTVGGT